MIIDLVKSFLITGLILTLLLVGVFICSAANSGEKWAVWLIMGTAFVACWGLVASIIHDKKKDRVDSDSHRERATTANTATIIVLSLAWLSFMMLSLFGFPHSGRMLASVYTFGFMFTVVLYVFVYEYMERIKKKEKKGEK